MTTLFDANARAKKREESQVLIGDRTFLPRRKTLGVLNAATEHTQTQEDAQRKLTRLGRQLESDDLADDRRNELEDQARELREDANRATFATIAVLLKPAEGEPEPDVDFLIEHLDVEDAGTLVGLLFDSASEPDPTPAGTTSGR